MVGSRLNARWCYHYLSSYLQCNLMLWQDKARWAHSKKPDWISHVQSVQFLLVLETPVWFSLLPFLGKTKIKLIFQILKILQDRTETNENWSSLVLIQSWTGLDWSSILLIPLTSVISKFRTTFHSVVALEQCLYMVSCSTLNASL